MRSKRAPRAGIILGASALALFTSLIVLVAQPRPSVADAQAVNPQQVQQGMGVIQQRGCGGCHTIPGIPGAQGTVGPDLGAHDDVPPVANRIMIATYPNGAVPNNSVNDLAAWITDPPSMKPGTAMPKLGLSPDDAVAAAAYLYAIQPDNSIQGIGGDGGSPGSGG